jgi:hypothetical protein
MGLLGFVVGITPCGPLLGVLTYIALSMKPPLVGCFYAFCFGLGASIVTPITVLGIIAGVTPRLIFKDQRILGIFKGFCGLMLIILGVRLILSQVLGNQQYW